MTDKGWEQLWLAVRNPPEYMIIFMIVAGLALLLVIGGLLDEIIKLVKAMIKGRKVQNVKVRQLRYSGNRKGKGKQGESHVLDDATRSRMVIRHYR
jgi:hypothetical protein